MGRPLCLRSATTATLAMALTPLCPFERPAVQSSAVVAIQGMYRGISYTETGECMVFKIYIQGLKLTLIQRSDYLLLLSKSWSKSDRHRSYFLSLKADIWLDWVAKLCS